MDAASSFRLLDLPFVPHRDVLRQMDVSSIFAMSFLDDSHKSLARELKLDALSMDLIVTPPVMCISVEIRKTDDVSAYTLLQLGIVSKTSTVIALNGEPTKMAVRGNIMLFESGTGDIDNLQRLEALWLHLMGMFQVKKVSAVLSMNAFDTFLFGHFQEFKSLTLQNQTLTADQIFFIVNNLRMDILKLECSASTVMNKPLVLPLCHRVIQLDSCKWFAFESLFTMDCQRLIVGKESTTNLRVAHIIEFIRLFVKGKFTKLKTVAIEVPEQWLAPELEFGYRSEIFDSLVAMDLVQIRSDGNRRIINCQDKRQAEISAESTFRFAVIQNLFCSVNAVLP